MLLSYTPGAAYSFGARYAKGRVELLGEEVHKDGEEELIHVSLDVGTGALFVIPHLQNHSHADHHKHFSSMAQPPKLAEQAAR